MTKETHTHRGHCQICCWVTAIDTATGRIAKHGYVVKDYGMFVGTCPGSGELSLHVERRLADRFIADARKKHAEYMACVEKLQAGKAHPAEAWNGEWKRAPRPTPRDPGRTENVEVMVPFAEASKYYQERAMQKEIAKYESRALQNQSFADRLESWADKTTGKVDAYRVVDLEAREWKVGDKVRIGGKSRDGFDAIIEAIEDRPYTTRGWGRGTSVAVPHARLTRPARAEKRGKPDGDLYPEGRILTEGRPAKVIWEPLRNIKRPKDALSALAEKLKEAGVL